MSKKVFHSQLYGKFVQPDDEEYWIKVYAESLFRYYNLVKADCSCFECKREREKLAEYLDNKKASRLRNEIKNKKP